MTLQLQSQTANSLPKVLLVDDEPRILRSLKAALKNHYDIFTANNGHEAKSIINDNQDCSVIVSDERMPDILGHELLMWSKHNHPKIIRILMTGYSDMRAIQNAINKAEIYKYISKPWNIQELKTIIDGGIVHVKSNHLNSQSTTAVHPATCELAILNMVDENDKIYSKVAKSMAMTHHIIHDIGTTLLVLQNNPQVGVLFIDDDHANQDTTELIMHIQQNHPAVVIMIATSAADGKNAIKLLNDGQIFRYLVKPLTETRLLPMLKAAVQRFQTQNINTEGSNELTTSGSGIKRLWHKLLAKW